jgi:hypothetical protein
MSSPSSALTPPKEQPKSTWDTAEQAVKIGTGFFALIYAAGFLVVSIHHGRYGIVMFEFLRARVFAAGGLLSIFIGVPIAATWAAILAVERMKGGTKFRRWFEGSSFLLGTLVIWTLGLGPWMSGIVQPNEFVWWTSPLKHPLPLFTACFLLVAGAFWFFHRGIWQQRFEADAGILFFLLGVLAIVSFAAWVYGNVMPGWGGGRPVPVTVHLSHKIVFSDSADVPAYLVDETERGYYLIHKADDRKASFIPRDAVASVDFEATK